MADGRFISYLRVSTEKQGRSGLGLEAQRAAVAAYLNGGAWEIVREYVETESGKRNDRPALATALAHARAIGASLIVAKLDRLSRNAAFLLTLRDAGVDFVAADMPGANRMTVGIMAVVAEEERRLISERTKAALAAAKARGQSLGSPKGAAHLRGRGNAEAVEAIKAGADRRAHDVAHWIEEARGNGATSARAVADYLNHRGIKTARGGQWYAASVQRALARAG
ncbi:recombinase family protein [Zavarzinia aquatilis]|uniref:Resolvase n=1 Tax=Zavarzinia aquatilis TaxID=2211142 RepID=A0A317EG79_9PROT|nr:recombinase family protein [Zavarzinia aquatilis]PWR24413.1 resolvase [Zavarzinia aquatilis]